MPLYFITGNKDKFEEASKLIPNLEQLDIDLPEIQSVDIREIIEYKLKEALKSHQGPLMVDDGSLVVDSANGLPGPLVKWFLQTIGAEGIYKFAKAFGNSRAKAICAIGYADLDGRIEYFEGVVRGSIIEPRINGFGWDPIFLPEGSNRTFAEMSKEEKNEVSHRGAALRKMAEFLNK